MTTATSMDLISTVESSPGAISVRPARWFAAEYLRDDFWVRYEGDGADRPLDEGLPLVPFLANVAPVVWLAGIDARVPVLDATFAKALGEVRRVYAQMYPDVAWEGSITADRLTDSGSPDEQVALLFSGGVDSVYSSITIGEPQLLVTVRGSDIALENHRGWAVVRESATEFARSRGHRNAFVETNFRRFLNIPVLESRWPEVGEWWPNVQHGIGLLGLVAPLLQAGAIVIAATRTPNLGDRPWGSNPRLDAAVRWGAAEVVHHGYQASRQRKVEAIVADHGSPPVLRVCYSNPYGGGRNCGRCEKCLRTFAALVAAGADPSDYGMPMPLEVGMRRIRGRFRTYRVAFDVTKPWYWGDIQQAVTRVGAPSDTDDRRSGFLSWLSGFDFATYERRWRVIFRARARMLRAMRRAPVTERVARRMVAGAHRLRARLAGAARR